MTASANNYAKRNIDHWNRGAGELALDRMLSELIEQPFN